MKRIKIYKSLDERMLNVVIVLAKFDNKWLLCKHKKRETWEICGGHIEAGEMPIEAAKRELYEESGAIAKNFDFLGYYSVEEKKSKTYGAIYYANILKFEKLPNFEMQEIKLFDEFPKYTTYANVYQKLLKKFF